MVRMKASTKGGAVPQGAPLSTSHTLLSPAPACCTLTSLPPLALKPSLPALALEASSFS